MTVHYTENERATLDRLLETNRKRASLSTSLYADARIRKDAACVQVWRKSPYGDVLQVSFPASPCPDVARLNAYRWVIHQRVAKPGQYFHAWEPQHVKQIAEAGN